MRPILGGLGLAAVLLLAGCNSWNQSRGGAAPPPTARVPAEVPSADALVHYLNLNARRVQTVDCRSLDIDAHQGRQAVGLSGWLVCEKPRNFRMCGKVMGSQAVDMGSNDQEFWYWVSKSDPPYLFHCSYEDYGRGRARLPFPFQPDWIMEAMGVAEYASAENFQVVPHATTIDLVENAVSPQGQRVRKVTVFQRAPAQGTAPQVLAHQLQDANGKVICAAKVLEVQYDRASGAILPRKMQIDWPEQHARLDLKLDSVTVNGGIEPERHARLFSRPVLRDVQTYDLARGLEASPTGLRRTGGIFR
jgi:hypothetical protein